MENIYIAIFIGFVIIFLVSLLVKATDPSEQKFVDRKTWDAHRDQWVELGEVRQIKYWVHDIGFHRWRKTAYERRDGSVIVKTEFYFVHVTDVVFEEFKSVDDFLQNEYIQTVDVDKYL